MGFCGNCIINQRNLELVFPGCVQINYSWQNRRKTSKETKTMVEFPFPNELKGIGSIHLPFYLFHLYFSPPSQKIGAFLSKLILGQSYLFTESEKNYFLK